MTTPVAPVRRGALESAQPLLVVAAGGATGALLRWTIGELAGPADGFAWATFAINVVGCFLLAALPAAGAVRRSPRWTLFLGPGLLGGFTTVSSWAHESRALAADGDILLAGTYVAATLLACLIAATAGRLLTRGVR